MYQDLLSNFTLIYVYRKREKDIPCGFNNKNILYNFFLCCRRLQL